MKVTVPKQLLPPAGLHFLRANQLWGHWVADYDVSTRPIKSLLWVMRLISTWPHGTLETLVQGLPYTSASWMPWCGQLSLLHVSTSRCCFQTSWPRTKPVSQEQSSPPSNSECWLLCPVDKKAVYCSAWIWYLFGHVELFDWYVDLLATSSMRDYVHLYLFCGFYWIVKHTLPCCVNIDVHTWKHIM